jgi:xylose isomerase
MRTYKLLAARAKAFDNDPEVKALIAETKDAQLDPLLQGGYSRDKAKALRSAAIDAVAVAKRGLGYERLDQLTIEHILGARG